MLNSNLLMVDHKNNTGSLTWATKMIFSSQIMSLIKHFRKKEHDSRIDHLSNNSTTTDGSKNTSKCKRADILIT